MAVKSKDFRQTKLPSNLRPTTCECAHSVTRVWYKLASTHGNCCANRCLWKKTKYIPCLKSKFTLMIFFCDYLLKCWPIFTVLHEMQTRSSDENSVCLSVKGMHCDKMKGRSVQNFIPYQRSFSLVFWEVWLVGATSSEWNFGSTGPRWSEMPILNR